MFLAVELDAELLDELQLPTLRAISSPDLYSPNYRRYDNEANID
jgi:hypothetical protein